jgi:hypothetical protein
MGCNFSKVTRESSPPLANRAQEAPQTGITGAATGIGRRSSPSIDPGLEWLPRARVQSPGSVPASRPPRTVIRPGSPRANAATSAPDRGAPTRVRAESRDLSVRSLARLDLPLGDVLGQNVIQQLAATGGNGASSPVLLDGGKIRVSYDPEYKIVRANFGDRYGPVNVELDDSGRGVKSIGGCPPPTKADLRYLANCVLSYPTA